MKKIILFFCFIIIPVFAYEVYNPKDYRYETTGDTLLFVLDFSNSMSEYIDHKTKVKHMQEMMNYVLPQISNNTKVGMRVYGHTCNPIAYNACRSSELIVPIKMDGQQEIISELTHLRPRGMTPITYSLKQAVNKDLQDKNGIKHLILLTDGGENCDESPCDYAIELVKSRRDIKIDVIAFDVADSEDLAQLQCTADVTGGNFVDAKTRAQLFRSMEDMILPHKDVEATILQTN